MCDCVGRKQKAAGRAKVKVMCVWLKGCQSGGLCLSTLVPCVALCHFRASKTVVLSPVFLTRHKDALATQEYKLVIFQCRDCVLKLFDATQHITKRHIVNQLLFECFAV